MLRNYKADLHIHTCLSPCTELDMSPQAIAQQAKEKEIDILGICDHNSAENVPALIQAAVPYAIRVLPGMEVTSQEEVHVLALFDSLESAFALQDIVYQHLPGENDEDAFGMQVVVNAEGEVLGFNSKLLIGATTLTIEEVTAHIKELDGLAIAAHIDREGFSLLGQLGFIPPHLPLDALEVSPRTTMAEAKARFQPVLPMTCSSDAHTVEDIGKGSTTFYIEEGTTHELKKAFRGEEGRRIIH
jgi:predicted metal-dependent phosphoesterase TrpH